MTTRTIAKNAINFIYNQSTIHGQYSKKTDYAAKRALGLLTADGLHVTLLIKN